MPQGQIIGFYRSGKTVLYYLKAAHIDNVFSDRHIHDGFAKWFDVMGFFLTSYLNVASSSKCIEPNIANLSQFAQRLLTQKVRL